MRESKGPADAWGANNAHGKQWLGTADSVKERSKFAQVARSILLLARSDASRALAATRRLGSVRGDTREQARHAFEEQRESDQDQDRAQRGEQRHDMRGRRGACDQRVGKLQHNR